MYYHIDMIYHIKVYPLKCAIHGTEKQLFCYLINSQIAENENGLLT